ncbi:MAG: hypothetical protein COB15_13565 [Flavobacteriales bacterium]|nr:MAG: hypothetical protein COB15_13565 [Flavobacteriales bacterium]
MRNSRRIVSLFIGLALILSSGCIIAQTEQYNLNLYGNILEGEKSDITIFREVDNDWQIIRTMKSRSKYNLYLNLYYKHYVVFHRRDGLTKALYVSKNEPGKWTMNFNVIFSDFSTRYIKIYKNPHHDSFRFAVVKKHNQEIVITKDKSTIQKRSEPE